MGWVWPVAGRPREVTPAAREAGAAPRPTVCGGGPPWAEGAAAGSRGLQRGRRARRLGRDPQGGEARLALDRARRLGGGWHLTDARIRRVSTPEMEGAAGERWEAEMAWTGLLGARRSAAGDRRPSQGR
jgi:hypothetical protein